MKYLISGWPFGTYNDKWDLEYAVKHDCVFVADYVPLIKKIKPGDMAFLRKYGEGIFAGGSIKRIHKDKWTYEIAFDKLEGLITEMPQYHFFKRSHNQNSRSRIIKLDKHDTRIIWQYDKDNENELMNEIMNYDMDAARMIEFSIQQKQDERYKTLYGKFK